VLFIYLFIYTAMMARDLKKVMTLVGSRNLRNKGVKHITNCKNKDCWLQRLNLSKFSSCFGF